MQPSVTEELPPTVASELGPFRRSDYERLPDEPRCELIYGRIYMAPSPFPRHQLLVSLLLRRLEEFAQSAAGLVFAAPLDVALSEHSVVQPDLIYLGAESSVLVERRIEGAPDLVVEVLSLSTVRRDRDAKLKLYAESGVREYWIVDPDSRQIEFLTNAGGRYQVAFALDGVYRSEAIAGLTLDVAGLWDEVERRLPTRG